MSLNQQEIQETIAELEQQKNHSLSDLHALSSLYSIRDHAFCGAEPENYQKVYSQAAAPIAKSPVLGNYGDSDFLVIVAGKLPEDAWGVMDDLMDTLRVANPRVYDSVMRKMRQL